MAVYQDREAFIPYHRRDLIEICIEDGKLSATDEQKFREFCEILSAYYHFHLHHTLEILKDYFDSFNPDADSEPRIALTSERKAKMEAELIAGFENILSRANYIALTEEMLQRVFQEKTLIELKTKVDFDDFERVVCYYRGDSKKITTVKKWFQQKKRKLAVFERVVLLLKFKDEAYFESKKIKYDRLNFTPGKIYIYFYKNIPKFDLELLFPNVKISMTWKDRILFGIPAIGAAIPIILKVIPQLLLIISTILFVVFGQVNVGKNNASKNALRDVTPVLVATLSLAMTFGGFAFKQYNSYKSKKVKFQKKVTDTLFFRNLANNASVFGALIDAAEEEECKEIILVYYHLLTSETSLTPAQLDDRIEEWMDEKFGTKIDFDINGPLHNLEAIRGKIVKEGWDEASTPEIPLLSYDERGFCKVTSLEDAKQIVDYVWDNAFICEK
ncbi:MULTISPECIES: TMEM143 family protein [Aerosakkonema]|uniref:TMEM143 family protein n=1 Tax=Aerosakkonema TaxID=1246629 RepID=UPI0035B8D588